MKVIEHRDAGLADKLVSQSIRRLYLDPAMGCAPVPATPAPQARDIPDAAPTPVAHHWHFEPRVGDDCMEDLVCAYCGVDQFAPEAGKNCPGPRNMIGANSTSVHERN